MAKLILSDDEFNSLPDAEPVSNKIVLSDDEFNSLPDAPATPEVEPITMTPNEPTPVADALTNAGKGIAHLFGERLYSEPPDQTQTEVIPQELDMTSMQTVRDRQAMLPPTMPQEPGYMPEGGLLSAAKASVPIAYQGTKLGILGAAQAAGENMPYSMENFMPPIPPELQADLAQRMAKTPMTPENIAQVQAPAAIEEIKRIREENQIRPGTVGSVATDVASSVAQFGPIAVASLIAPVVAPAGLAFLATVSGGQQYNKARNAGFTEEQALAQGVVFGAAEAIGEKIGLDYLMKSLSNPALMSGIKGILKAAVKNAGVEGGEEMLTQGLQNATEIIAKKINPQTKGEAPTLLQDVPYAGFVGGLSGAGMGAIGAAIQNYANPPKQEAPPQPEQEQTPPEQPAQESPTATEPPPQKMEQTTEELAVPPEPAPTVIQQPREADARLERVQPEFQQEPRPEMRPQPIDQLFRRERTITQPEAATTPVAEPEGIKPQPVAPTVTQPAPITFRKEAERKIKPEPENKGIIARPAAEVGIKEYEKLPENVWLHGTDIDGEIKNFSVTDTERGVYLTKNWRVAENYTDGDTAKIKAIELKKDANIFDLNDDAQAEKLAKLLKERIDDFADFDIKEFAANLQKADYNQVGLIDNAEIGNVLYEANVDAVIDTKGNAAIINDNALKTYRPEGEGMTVQPAEPMAALDQMFKPKAEAEVKVKETEADLKPVGVEDFGPEQIKEFIETVEMFDEVEKSGEYEGVKISPKDAETFKGIKERAQKRILQAKPWQMTKEQYVNSRMADVKNKYPNATTKSLEMQKAKLESDYDAAIQNIPRDAEMLPEVLDSLSEKQRKQIFKFNENLEKEYFDKKNDASQMTYKQYLNWLDAKNYRWQKNKQAHKQIVKRAIEAGKSVPPEVLAEYPDLNQPRPKTGPSMFGGAQLQNAYEKVEPTLKKGADLLFKKGRQAYEAARRNADITRDMGRVVDITEKNGKAVETEAPKRGTRIGMFNLQDVYDMVTKPFTKRAEDEKLKRHLDTNIDADVRKSMEEARGIEPLPFTERAKQAITNIKNQVTRKFPDLDDRKYPELADRLRVLSEARDYADGNADAIIRDNIKDLSQQEYNEFSNKLILEDIKRGLENGLYTTNDLPFNLTPQKLDNALKQLSPAELTAKGFGETSRRIEDAIQKRNDAFRSVKQRSVDLGILPPTIMNDDRYFHHQVLYYMNMQDAIRAGKTGVRLGKKSYTIGRQKDSLSDFNTEYAQAEFEVLSDMVEDQQKAEFIKYVESLDLTPQLKAEALAQNLPQDRKTLQKLMPDTHEPWQPKEGNNFYKVFTIPERIVNEILKSQDAVDVGLDDINEALAVGGPKRELILPKDITKTLDEFGKKTAPDNVLHKFSQLTNKAFKTLALFMPSRATNYMLTNAFGDADVVMAYALDGMKRLPEAVKELIKGDRKNNKDLEDAYKYRVIGTGITEKEIAEMSYDKVMKNITLKQILNPIAWGKKYLETVGRINAMRENSLRYAMFKNFLERFRNGERNIYGASDRQSIDNLPDNTQKAARLARDLMGDYGNVSALGDYIAKYHIPFYRWMEINMPRYYRMIKNAPFEGGYQGAFKGGAKAMKRFVQMNIMGAVLYQLYHAALGAVTGDDELRKARDVSKAKGQPHVIVPNYLIGNDVKDDVKTVRAQSAFSDVTELLLGTSDWFSDAMDVATGKMKFGEKMRDLGWKFDNPSDILNMPPIRKVAMAAWPVQRFAAEMVFGKAPTKRPTELRTIRDRQQHLARFLTLGTPYNIAADKPAPKKGMADAVLYTTDLGEAAYQEIMSKKNEFMRNKGLPIPTASDSPAGTAYYNLRQAMKYGERAQIRKYFKEYNAERIKSGREARDFSDVVDDIKQGVDIDSGMSAATFNEFLKSLSTDDKRRLREAMRWVKKTYK